MEREPKVWGIRAGGEHFDASKLFKEQQEICIGWPDVGDLSQLPADQLAIKQRLIDTHQEYPDVTMPRIGQGAGHLYRFRYVMKCGDIVVYEDDSTYTVYIGTVVGPYRYDRSTCERAPHLRQVKWKHKFPRHSIASKFSVRGHALWEILNNQEFLDLMEG